MRRRAALLLCAAAFGCAPAPPGPAETLERYLDALAGDPIRTLAMLTPGFHDRHGLRFEEVADRPFAAPRRAAPSADPLLERERARLGWLTVLTKRIFALQSGRFRHRVVSEAVRGDVAEVVVQVEPPPLEARFELRRGARGGGWQIDAVHLPDLDESQWLQAFLIAPDAELHRRIAAARERRPGRGHGVRRAWSHSAVQSGTQASDQTPWRSGRPARGTRGR